MYSAHPGGPAWQEDFRYVSQPCGRRFGSFLFPALPPLKAGISPFPPSPFPAQGIIVEWRLVAIKLLFLLLCISSVQFSCSAVSNSLRPYGLQHARPPCSSPTPGVYSNSCPLGRWCHPTISSSVIPFSSCLHSFSASGSFPRSQFFASGSQSIGASASNEYLGLISLRIDWFDLLAVQGTLKNLLQHYSSKASILWHSAFFMVQLSHPYMTTGKTTALTRQTFVGKVTSLLFNMLSRFVITFPPRSKHLFNFVAAVTICSDFGAQNVKSLTVSNCFPSVCYEVMGPDAMILVFWMLSFKPTF